MPPPLAPGLRRPQGSGSIQRYRASQWIARTPTGTHGPRHLGIYDTRREAEQALAAWMRAQAVEPTIRS